MHKLSCFLFITALFAASNVAAATQGEIKVQVGTIPVRVSSSSPDLQTLAYKAFSVHGLYNVHGGGTPSYEFKFTAVGANQVRVDITKAGAPFASQAVGGRTLQQALLRAADVAVEKTNGQNPSLRGFFTARLAFVAQKAGRSEVYISDLFLGEARQLTQDGASVLSPRWAPDGSRVIYTSYRTRAPNIYLQDPVSGAKSIYAEYKGTNMGARFSPNGQQVAMVLTAEGPSEIYVRGAQGGAPVRKTNVDSPKSSPCWSPDGSQIVFAMGESSQLNIISAAGGTPRRISTGYNYVTEPDWSRANPNKIVCTVRAPGGRFQIAVVDVPTGATEIVSNAPFDAVEPSWLADGRHVVCTIRDRKTSVLAVLDTKNKKYVPISSVSDGALMQAGVWTP